MKRTFVDPKEYKGKQIKVTKLVAPPVMDKGAPEPAVNRVGDKLFLAYICHNPEFPGWDSGALPNHPGFETYSALIRFDGVSEHYIGPPNDEALDLHPLYGRGLGLYDFWEANGSPKAVPPLHHWIFTFHDQTVEVVAENLTILNPRVPGEDTQTIVASCA